MKLIVLVTSLLFLLSVSGLVSAGEVTAECKKQAKEYNIQAELVSQYVQDCITSMGGDGPSDTQALGGADSASRSDAEGSREEPALAPSEGVLR